MAKAIYISSNRTDVYKSAKIMKDFDETGNYKNDRVSLTDRGLTKRECYDFVCENYPSWQMFTVLTSLSGTVFVILSTK